MDTILIYLNHSNGKITQKRVSNNYELFCEQIFEFTNKTEAASDYLIQYKKNNDNWINIESKKDFKDLLKKSKKIIKIQRKEPEEDNENLTKLFCNHLKQCLKISKFNLFEKIHEKIQLERLGIKEQVRNAIEDKKENEKMELQTKNNSYVYQPIENPFNLYNKINDLIPDYKKIPIQFNEMNLIDKE